MTSKRICHLIFALSCVFESSAFARDDKPIMPAYVLAAHTVSVVIEPGAGVSLDDPHSDEMARKDVETALLNWGRFNPVASTQQADLVIVVHKGHKKLAEETMPEPRPTNRSGPGSGGQDGITIGSRRA